MYEICYRLYSDLRSGVSVVYDISTDIYAFAVSTCISQRSHSCPLHRLDTGSSRPPSPRLPFVAYDQIHVIFVQNEMFLSLHVTAQQAEKTNPSQITIIQQRACGRSPSRLFSLAREYERGLGPDGDVRLRVNLFRLPDQ